MKRRSSASHVTVDPRADFVHGDGFESFLFGTEGPFRSLAEAAAGWERYRTESWEVWASDVKEPGIRRGPWLWPPRAAMSHDGFGDAANRCRWPMRDTSAVDAVAAADADLESVAAFTRARPREAAAIASPLALFEEQLQWYRGAALRAGDDYAEGERLVYGPPPDQGDQQ